MKHILVRHNGFVNKDTLLLKIEGLIEKLDHSIKSQIDARQALLEAKETLENE